MLKHDVVRPSARRWKVTDRLHEYIVRMARNPRWLLMDAVSRFGFARRVASRLGARTHLHDYRLSESRFPAVDVDDFVAAVIRDGFCTGLTLPESSIQTLQQFAAESHCFGDADKSMGFRYRDKAKAQQLTGRVFSQATYLNRDEVQPVLDELANDPLLLTIATKYLRARPVITGTRMWWTFSSQASTFDSSITTSFFHYDKDDYAALRLFFYLTDVDKMCGPHVVVRGSHRNKALSQVISLRERTDSEIIEAYGLDTLVTIYGKAGEGFAEDPFCFHKATRPIAGDRLLVELKYARRDYQSFPAIDKQDLQVITG